MKQILALIVALTITTTAFSQAGQKWSTSGNVNASGDFIGSTNNEPLKFKTNDIVRGKFTKDGDFLLKSLEGLGFRLLQTDSTGTLSSFPMSSVNEVLYGDGVWRPLPTPPPSTWELNGTSLFYLNGKVGIGTKTPFTNFDVIGDAYISNNLYVGGGIIITEKVNANVEVVTSKLKADTIVMDSTKGIYGYSIFKDRVKLENKLQVVGNTQIDGNFRVNGDFIFGNNKHIGYLPPSGGNPEIISFGRVPSLDPFVDPCVFPTATTYNQFSGMIQAWGYSDNDPINGKINVMKIGYDGANGIIDMKGIHTDGSDSKLLINWYCGKDVAINANPAKGGNVTMTSATMGMVGIGTGTPTAKLDVLGTFKLRDGSQGANKVLVSNADGVASWQEPSTIDDGKWALNGTDIYRLTGNVGIGTSTPTAKLDVIGGIKGSGDFISNGFMQSALGYKFPDGSIQTTATFSLGSQSSPFQEIYVNNYIKIGTNSLWLNSGAGGNNEIYTTNGALVINPVGVSVGGGPASTGENTYINPTLGNVAIGTTFSGGKLTIGHSFDNGNGRANHIYLTDPTNNKIKGYIGINKNTAAGIDMDKEYLSIQAVEENVHWMNIVLGLNGGNVGIGTEDTKGYRFAVNGNMIAEEIVVKHYTNWPDFVFNKEYQLTSLEQIEDFIRKNNHLPNVPSEKEVQENGISLGKMDAILLQKIEELTLYILEQNKRIAKLEQNKLND